MLGRQQNSRPHGNNCSEDGGEIEFKHDVRHWFSTQQLFTVALAVAVVVIWVLVIYKVFLD
jgi:hypothetical protein